MSAYVTLNVDGETYAVSVRTVHELVVVQPLTHVPTMPPCIRGLMNLRGTVLPVVDLARQLGLGETEIGPQTCVIVVETSRDRTRAPMGVLTNEVQDVLELTDADIGPVPAFGATVNPDYLAGVTRVNGRYVLILDLTKILTPDELLAVSEVA
ncbi:MAG TPA: chemotaxis protein CheW [Thermoanaerobaculia bacterium]|nr:chemotaxis protein CheW [Thermoanaerobaculia bacterium]